MELFDVDAGSRPRETRPRPTQPQQTTQDILYVIHFATPLCHAQHYIGSSVRILARLRDHARSAGSRIIQVCNEHVIEWHVAALYARLDTTRLTIRQIEAQVKRRHHHKLYCHDCIPVMTPPNGTVMIPVPPGLNSKELQ